MDIKDIIRMGLALVPKVISLVVALIIALSLAMPVVASTASALLEQGIYTEETVGDLDGAMALYEQVVADEKANRPHVAQAQFRLAMCHVKQGNEAKARQAFTSLIRDFSDQDALVERAREQLTRVTESDPEIVPWVHGEALDYRLTLNNGTVLGDQRYLTAATTLDGIEAWSLTTAKLTGTSRVWFDRQTLRPLESIMRDQLFGHVDATYGPDGVTIDDGKGDVVTVPNDQLTYDHEQFMMILRSLPLTVGYETTVPLLAPWMEKTLEFSLKVVATATCDVPAGRFECLEVDCGVFGTYWFTTGPEQHLVQVDGGGVKMELMAINEVDPAGPWSHAVEDFGFTTTVPAGWLPLEHRRPDQADRLFVRFYDPDDETMSNLEVDRCPSCTTSLQERAEKERGGAEERFEDFVVREGSWTERTIDGRPGISFVGDYVDDEAMWVQYRIYTFANENRFEFIFRVPAERFDALRPMFDAVVESLEVE